MSARHGLGQDGVLAEQPDAVVKVQAVDKRSKRGLKTVALVFLVLQNSSASVLMRQSRSTSSWIPQTGVIFQELIKGLLSLCLMLLAGDSLSAVVENPRELARTGIPAFLYLLQNNLQYISVLYLDAATYTVTYQLKILSTAFMSVLLLKRRLDCEKWTALMVLVVGVSMVQLSVMTPAVVSGGEHSDIEDHVPRQLVGLGAVLMACVLSGLAGVYFEMILKDSKVSLWVRNVQLAGYSIIIGFFGLACTDDLAKVRSLGFFHGYTRWTFAAVLDNSFGGLLIAVVIKYADNIVKNFATSLSIVLTTVVCVTLFGLEASRMFMCGVGIVCYSTFLYGGVVGIPWLSRIVGHVQECAAGLAKGAKGSPPEKTP